MENKVETVENTEQKKKEPMTTKQKVFLGLRIAFNVVFYALIIFLFLFSLMNIRGGNGTTNFPNIFGKGFLSVQSDSMKRTGKEEDWPVEWKNYKIGGFQTGDLVNVDVFNKNDADKLQVGDVITYQWTVNGQPALNTHRIVEKYVGDNGALVIITQGDKMAITNKYNPDASAIEKYAQENVYWEVVNVDAIRGVVTGVNSGAGKVLDTIQKNWLFIFVIPIIVLLVIEIFLVIRNIMLLRGEKNKLELADTKEAMLAEVEAEKEKMRQELLAELRAQGLAPAEDPKPADETKPEESQVAEEAAPVEAAVVATEEEKVEEPQEEVKEEITKVEDTPEEAPIEEAKEEEPAQVEEIKEESEPEVAEEAPIEETQPEAEEPVAEEVKEEVKEETVEEKKETPKKAAPKKSSTTAKKSTSTTKKTTSTTKKSTKKTEE